MAKIKTVGSIKEFMSKKQPIELTAIEKEWSVISKVLGGAGASLILAIPDIMAAAPQAVAVGEAVATTAETFDNVYISIMNMFDQGVVLVIIFASGAWCLGHRGKAIEILLGVCCGYILARHAKDIRDWLKKI